MALIDFDKFIASFIAEMKECSQMRNFSIPRCIKKALIDQGLDYKNGEIVKVQRRVSAEAKETGYGESEDEKIRKALIRFHKSTIGIDGIKGDETVSWLEKQGQKPADKVENFQEGDWVVYKNDICQIVKREEGCNKLVTVFGIEKELVNERNLSTARLWTIQDARDGDVLFAENFDNIGGCVFLFKGLDSWKFDAEGDRAVATGYCCASITESGNTDFGIQADCVEIKRVHPASKDQRDLLFQKMHEAGYMWDSKSKQLLSLKAEPSNTQTPIGWSEEDEKMVDKILTPLAIRYPLDIYQPMYNWLKSLKERYVWKPSEAQMRALHDMNLTGNISYAGQGQTLIGLYNDLKKL